MKTIVGYMVQYGIGFTYNEVKNEITITSALSEQNRTYVAGWCQQENLSETVNITIKPL